MIWWRWHLLGMLLLLCLSGASSLWAAKADPFDPAGTRSAEDEIFRLTNVERVKLGLLPCLPYPPLNDVAREHSGEMVKLSYFDHVSPVPGRTMPWDRVALAGLKTLRVAENIYDAEGYPWSELPNQCVQSWMHSPGHRANIVEPENTHMGIGVVIHGQVITVTQVFSGEIEGP